VKKGNFRKKRGRKLTRALPVPPHKQVRSLSRTWKSSEDVRL
jgi:hypothetical protein